MKAFGFNTIALVSTAGALDLVDMAARARPDVDALSPAQSLTAQTLGT